MNYVFPQYRNCNLTILFDDRTQLYNTTQHRARVAILPIQRAVRYVIVFKKYTWTAHVAKNVSTLVFFLSGSIILKY